jgi:hypothetical protein
MKEKERKKERSIVYTLLSKFNALYNTRLFVTVFTKARC